jgi:ribonuclease HI
MVYAVARGRAVGIYVYWQDCSEVVSGVPGAMYKKFATVEEAVEWLRACGVPI